MQYRFAKTVLTGVLVAAFTATAIAADGFLADRHGAKGVKCEMCHVTATGGKLKMVDEGKHEVCVQCHGFYDKVVQLTETKDEQPLNGIPSISKYACKRPFSPGVP